MTNTSGARRCGNDTRKQGRIQGEQTEWQR